ncbi:RNA polymerase sigma-70 factor, sigma-E family [Streptomyces sp. DI166]|uniref:SigE family RNA polymerase sigma factor n=1 Tax=unclassified Streptomyces TaxID=2593676 RepID=UPI0007F45321|nr:MULTISPECIES: SigE family RNA polymerase sigma factor [unclassified Streptomyces]SBT90433.1 RNA polymerase sigma-70 factor, sigma-E family [Streptomyces sp. DI166]
MAGRRDEEAFSEFVQLRSRALLRTAYLLSGGDHALAEDLLQSALVKAYVALPRLREPRALEAYVRRTLANTATSWWRSRRVRGERLTGGLPEGALDVPDPVAPDGASEVDERERIWAWVCSLPPRQRAVIVLRYYEDLTEPQTAELLSCSVGTVKTQAHRALKKLRAMVAGGLPNAVEEAL